MKAEMLKITGIEISPEAIIAKPDASAKIGHKFYDKVEIKSQRIKYDEVNQQQSGFEFELINIEKDDKNSILHLSGTFNPLNGTF